MRVCIGIDPGTRCGWAVLAAGGARIASGTWSLERRRGDGAGMVYVRFERLFRELLSTYEDAVVAYEQQANRYAGAAHIGLGIISHVQRICEDVGVPYTGVAFATVKRRATGRGNASKGQVYQAALAAWGEIGDDNEADALWVADVLREGLV